MTVRSNLSKIQFPFLVDLATACFLFRSFSYIIAEFEPCPLTPVTGYIVGFGGGGGAV